MTRRWIVKVYDCGLCQLTIRNIKAHFIIVAEPGRSPIYFDDFNMLPIDDEPISDLVGTTNLKAKSCKDIAERVLKGETNDDGDQTRPGQQTGNGDMIKERETKECG